MSGDSTFKDSSDAVAIIGMAGRFPGARDLDEFWRNLRSGVESIAHFSDRELLDAGVSPKLLEQPRYVKAGGPLADDIGLFDADFFGVPPSQARLIDPQQRIFLEASWHAFEDAGYDPETFEGLVGVYAGVSSNAYFLRLLSPEVMGEVGQLGITTANDKDYLASRVSFKLNLKGPSVSVQTACSTSMVAVHMARESLLNGECDMALAGGVRAGTVLKQGYLHDPDSIYSPDGRCRPFADSANGTVFTNGLGVVVLKRLEDARRDGDAIRAVILGSAVNNDGADKVGYTAPSAQGQYEVVTEALAQAGVSPETIDYVEAHGTGTALGDPIEVRALKRAFDTDGDQRNYCALGSVKSNIGHCDVASGIAGLIKTVQALEHGEMPPSLHFEKPNPEIDFDESPFFVNTELREWRRRDGLPRRAGVSSFGIGGTNAHAVLEEATTVEPSGPSRPVHLLRLSARTAAALEDQSVNLGRYLENHPEVDLADVSHTLWLGRRAFEHRRVVVCRDHAEALSALMGVDGPRRITTEAGRRPRPVAFLFPGQGAQYAGMGGELYRTEPTFRAQVDACCELLEPDLGLDLRVLLYPARGEIEAAQRQLDQTALAQPALFVTEFCLARLLQEWGLEPAAMLGHSIGEYVAACLAGVFSLADALALVAERGRLMQSLPPGAMLAVPLPAAEVEPLLDEGLSLAAINAPDRCVVSGPALEALEQRLAARDVVCRWLRTSHAFHSAMMDPILERFGERVRGVELHPPRIPVVSNVTGQVLSARQATDPDYWVRHLRRTVQFAQGLGEILAEDKMVLEVGPGRTLGSASRRHPALAVGQEVLPTLGGNNNEVPELLTTLGRLWGAGVAPSGQGFFKHQRRRRVALPGYPFERRRFWAEAREPTGPAPEERPRPSEDWYYVPRWRSAPLPPARPPTASEGGVHWLLLLDPGGLGAALAERLRSAGRRVSTALAGADFADLGDGAYQLRPECPEDYRRLIERLVEDGGAPDGVVHLWTLGEADHDGAESSMELGFWSLLFLAQAQVAGAARPRLHVVTRGLLQVDDDDIIVPRRATLLGPLKVLPLEYPGLFAGAIDIGPPSVPAEDGVRVERLLAELAAAPEALVAYRGTRRMVQSFESVSLVAPREHPPRLRPEGVYLITGGFGGLGATFARHLAGKYHARLVLLGRTGPRIHLVRELEAAGAEVMAVQSQVTDEDRMRRVISEIKARFGRLDGVIHAAGVVDAGLIPDKTREAAAAVMAPKIEGTLALSAALGAVDLDFFVLCSSTAAALGGLAQVDYSAANAFLDAFAQSRAAAGGGYTVSIAWDAWQEVGMAATDGRGTSGLLAGGILPSEGVEMLEQVLAHGALSVVIACKRDFSQLVERARALLRPVSTPSPNPLRHPRPQAAGVYAAPRNETERRLADIWRDVLGIEEVGGQDSFFDLGGDSLLLMQARNQISHAFERNIAMPVLFRYPTVAALAAYLRPAPTALTREPPTALTREPPTGSARVAAPGDRAVAIIGMSGRFPGARNLDEFWRNLKHGVESIAFFTDEELEAEGYHPEILRMERFVKALPLLEDGEWFDAKHFGITPREAETIDPQHRVFLETAWEALEHGGYNPEAYPGVIGSFAGAGVSRYWLNVASDAKIFHSVGVLQVVIGNDKDYLPTRVAFKLNLKGPSVNVQSACSTSLIAIHLACQSLLNGECEMALAGGVAMAGTKKGGYVYEEGGIHSPDGHCRAFDAKARGTVFGSGSGAVLLKPLANALNDGDTIHAVIRGSAINNDGAEKVGYTAPGVDGQLRVIRDAQRAADVAPETISYIEAHGTATELGDPIEVAALREIFHHPDHTCALGSVKSNIGHADAAAGIAGMLKTVLALKHGQIPPNLHFEKPNPELELESSPFHVHNVLSDWPASGGQPRRAGVSAFGVGGSNAHIVVEEAPPVEPTGPSRAWQLLVLSGRTPTALEAMTTRLAEHLENHSEINLADVAHTLEAGRKAFPHRRILVCPDRESALAGLRGEGASIPVTGTHNGKNPPVVFFFPGQGAQYVDMGRELYEHEEVFRRQFDHCRELLLPHLDIDLRTLLFPTSGSDGDKAEGEAAELLSQTRFTQPALFVIEVALARQWMAWGVQPAGMVGHSIGEYVAAHLAGVFSLADALALVAARGRLMQSVDPGAMLSVPLAADELLSLMWEASSAGELSLAALNAPERSVVSGTFEAVDRLMEILDERDIEARRLHTSHAFHSPMMDPILEDFRRVLGEVELSEPQQPFFSNLSGRLISASEARDPEYWVRHLRSPVRFAAAIEELCRESEPIFLEVGPGRTLGSLAKLHPVARKRTAISSLRRPGERGSDQASMLSALGRLWLASDEVSLPTLHSGERRRRVPLPTYPFERQRYYVEEGDLFGQKKYKSFKNTDLSEWFYIPVWKPSDLTAERELASELDAPCLVFADDTGLAEALGPRLEERLEPVIYVRGGETFARPTDQTYTVNPCQRSDFEALVRELREEDRMPRLILFLWAVTSDPPMEVSRDAGERYLAEGIYALFHLAQLLEEIGEGDPIHLVVVSTGVQAVDGSESLVPEKATLVGPMTVIPQEYRNIQVHGIDLVLPPDWRKETDLLDRLLEEIVNEQPEMAIAYRRGRRWVQAYEQVKIEAKPHRKPYFREHGCYLVTGGLGGLGLTFARHLAEQARARLILTGRSALPRRETWPEWLAEHGDDDAMSRKILQVRELETLGAEVMVVSADVTDRDRMAVVIDEARGRFGPIHGVLHAAGLPSGGLVQNKELETIVETLGPKVQGTRVLESVLAGEKLDFFVLFSSSGAILGGLGYYDYCAANAFLDAFAHARTAAGNFTQAINWGPWQEAGMAVVSNMGFLNEEAHQAFLRQGIASAEGMEVFQRILDRRFPQIAVWTMDFPLMIERARLLSPRGNEEDETRVSHPRPELAIDFEPPRDKVESELSEVWRDLLGIAQVGIHDDFFELGADSLLATQMLSRVRRQLGVSIAHHKLFETPNIEALAAIIRDLEADDKMDDIEALLAEVEEASEDEMDEMDEMHEVEVLAQQSRGGP